MDFGRETRLPPCHSFSSADVPEVDSATVADRKGAESNGTDPFARRYRMERAPNRELAYGRALSPPAQSALRTASGNAQALGSPRNSTGGIEACIDRLTSWRLHKTVESRLPPSLLNTFSFSDPGNETNQTLAAEQPPAQPPSVEDAVLTALDDIDWGIIGGSLPSQGPGEPGPTIGRTSPLTLESRNENQSHWPDAVPGNRSAPVVAATNAGPPTASPSAKAAEFLRYLRLTIPLEGLQGWHFESREKLEALLAASRAGLSIDALCQALRQGAVLQEMKSRMWIVYDWSVPPDGAQDLPPARGNPERQAVRSDTRYAGGGPMRRRGRNEAAAASSRVPNAPIRRSDAPSFWTWLTGSPAGLEWLDDTTFVLGDIDALARAWATSQFGSDAEPTASTKNQIYANVSHHVRTRRLAKEAPPGRCSEAPYKRKNRYKVLAPNSTGAEVQGPRSTPPEATQFRLPSADGG